MSALQQITEHAVRVAAEIELCSSCLGRLYMRQAGLSSCKRLGIRIRREIGQVEPTGCHICRGLIRTLDCYADRCRDRTLGIEFTSFVLGTTLPHAILDRDDAIRSRYRLRGAEGIKSCITRELTSRLRRVTGARVEHAKPEMTVTVDFRDGVIHVQTAPVVVTGRYLKLSRGTPQRSPQCAKRANCCDRCKDGGACSIEGQISEFLCSEVGASGTRVTCVGGEDPASLVLGDGRPFFAKLLNPRRRSCKFPDAVKLPGAELVFLKVEPNVRVCPVPFRSVIKILVELEGEAKPQLLRSLKSITASPVLIDEGRRINRKTVTSLKYRRKSPSSILLTVEVDGGFPVKRFVEDKGVTPSVPSMLGSRCMCRRFDFLQVSTGPPWSPGTNHRT